MFITVLSHPVLRGPQSAKSAVLPGRKLFWTRTEETSWMKGERSHLNCSFCYHYTVHVIHRRTEILDGVGSSYDCVVYIYWMLKNSSMHESFMQPSPYPSPHPPASGDPRTVRWTKAPSALLLLLREKHADPLPILITRIYLSLEFAPSVRKDVDTGCGRVKAQVGGKMKCLEIILATWTSGKFSGC